MEDLVGFWEILKDVKFMKINEKCYRFQFYAIEFPHQIPTGAPIPWALIDPLETTVDTVKHDRNSRARLLNMESSIYRAIA